jgi:uncharacterized protein (UPF0261 family)
MPKTILIIGTLNTKESEGYYLKQRIEEFEHKVILLDASMKRYRPELGKPEISNEEVAKAAGTTIEKVESLERAEAGKLMIEGMTKIVKELYNHQKLDGIVGYGGSVGLTLSSSTMKALPLGIPKLVITTLADKAGRFIGAKDILVCPSITDMAGGRIVNRIEATMLANAAAAISGMVKSNQVIPEEKPLIVASQFGVTTPHVSKAKQVLENKGYEFIPFHATGTGGQWLEELVRSGIASGVLDVTTHELVDELVGGVCLAGPNRMEAAGDQGVPQIILPGALDMVNFWAPNTVPEKFKNRYFYYHIPEQVTLMRTTKAECEKLGKIVAQKINKASGPTVVAIPLRGWSQYDVEDGPMCVDYVGNDTKVKWHNPENDEAFVESVEKHVDKTKTNVEIMKFDLHINDPKFAELTAKILDDMINRRWKKGHYG